MILLVKIIVSSQPPGGLDSLVDPRFGRCSTFTIVDVDNSGKILNVQVIPNSAANAPGGAGIQATQLVASTGAQVIITGNLGPNASRALQQLGVAIFVAPLSITVRDAIMQYLSGMLQPFMGTPSGYQPYGGGMGRGMGQGRGRGGGRGRGRGQGGSGRGWF